MKMLKIGGSIKIDILTLICKYIFEHLRLDYEDLCTQTAHIPTAKERKATSTQNSAEKKRRRF